MLVSSFVLKKSDVRQIIPLMEIPIVMLSSLGLEVEVYINLLENKAKPNTIPNVWFKFVFLSVVRISYCIYFVKFFNSAH